MFEREVVIVDSSGPRPTLTVPQFFGALIGMPIFIGLFAGVLAWALDGDVKTVAMLAAGVTVVVVLIVGIRIWGPPVVGLAGVAAFVVLILHKLGLSPSLTTVAQKVWPF